MRMFFLVLITMVVSVAPSTLCHSSDMIDEGSGIYEAAMTATFRRIPMEKERLEMQFEVVGVVADAFENNPLYEATIYALSELHSVNGEYTEKGFARYTRPDGDTVFMVHEASGKLGGERTIRGTFVGGTGRCAGIMGTAEFSGLGRFKSPKEGVMASISKGTFNWKLP